MRAVRGDDDLLDCVFVDALAELALPNVFEKDGRVEDVDPVHERRKEPLDLETQLLIKLDHFLVGNILELSAFEINDDNDLVDALLVDELRAVRKLDPPGVLELLDEVMNEHIRFVVQGTHQLQELNLADVDHEHRSAFLVGRVEPIRTQFLDLFKLAELVVLQSVWLHRGLLILTSIVWMLCFWRHCK